MKSYEPSHAVGGAHLVRGAGVGTRVAIALGGMLAVLGLGFATAHSSFDLGVVQVLNMHFTGAIHTIVNDIYLALEPGWAVLIVVAIAAILGWARRSWLVFSPLAHLWL